MRSAEDIDDFHFGNFITAQRNLLNLSLKDAVLRSGLSHRRIKELESGMPLVSVRHSECVALARIYHLDADDLLKLAMGEDPYVARSEIDVIYSHRK